MHVCLLSNFISPTTHPPQCYYVNVADSEVRPLDVLDACLFRQLLPITFLPQFATPDYSSLGLQVKKFGFSNCKFFLHQSAFAELGASDRVSIDSLVTQNGSWSGSTVKDLIRCDVIICSDPTKASPFLSLLSSLTGCVLADISFVATAGARGCGIRVAKAGMKQKRTVWMSKRWQQAHPKLCATIEACSNHESCNWTCVGFSRMKALWRMDSTKPVARRRPMDFLGLVTKSEKTHAVRT